MSFKKVSLILCIAFLQLQIKYSLSEESPESIVNQTDINTNQTNPEVEEIQNKTTILPRYNCTRISREEIAQLIVLNSSSIPSYLQLKNYFIFDILHLKQLVTQNLGEINEISGTQLQQQDKNNETTTATSAAINSTETESKETSGTCAVLIFYYNWCRFSAAAAPKFNAIGRLFPQIYIIAIEAYYYYSVTIKFGVSGVPSIYFLHNGRAVAKYNKTEITMNGLFDFIKSLTSFEPNITRQAVELDGLKGDELLNVTNFDLQGPLVIKSDNNTNFLLIFCWIFCLIVFFYYFLTSTLFARFKEYIRALWNEAHEHVD